MNPSEFLASVERHQSSKPQDSQSMYAQLHTLMLAMAKTQQQMEQFLATYANQPQEDTDTTTTNS